MRTTTRSPRLVILVLSIALASPLLAQSQPQSPALGIVVTSSAASIGNSPASEGASIYSGDYLSTQDNGSLLLRVGPVTLQLESSSALHIYSAPYGAVVELNRGSVIYTTPGGKQNVVIVASDVRVTPDPALADLGRVTIDNPCEVTAYNQRGRANVQVGHESRFIEQGKAYRVRAEAKISYREYLSPDDSDYHRHHDHEPCAVYMTHLRLPAAPMHDPFALTSAAFIAAGTVIGVYKAMESPDRP